MPARPLNLAPPQGAAEWVLKRCVATLTADGRQEPLSDARREELLGVVTAMAKRGLRCICLTYRDYAEGVDAAQYEDPNAVDQGLIAVAIGEPASEHRLRCTH